MTKQKLTDRIDHFEGVDLPAGGSAGEVLTKDSNADNDFNWSAEPKLYGNIISQEKNGLRGIALGVDVLAANTLKVLNTCVLIGQSVASKFVGQAKNVVAIGSRAAEDDLKSDSVAIGSFVKLSKEGVTIGYSSGSGANELTAVGNYTGLQSDPNCIVLGHRVDCRTNDNDSSDSIFISTNQYKVKEESKGSIVLETPDASFKSIAGGPFHASTGLSANNEKIIDVADPEQDQDCATKSYVDKNSIKSVFDLEDVTASAADPLRDDDVLTWDSAADHFRFHSKHEFKYAIEASKGVQSCADLVAHYVAYLNQPDGTKKTIFHMKTNATQHSYTTQQGAAHVFAASPLDSDQAQNLATFGLNGCLFLKPVQFNQGISLFDNRISNLSDPENPKDAVNLEYLRDYVDNHGGTNDEGQIGALDHLQFDSRKVFEVESNAYCLLQDKIDEELLALRVGFDGNSQAINYEARYGNMFQFHSFDDEDKNKTLLLKMNRTANRFYKISYFNGGIDLVNTRIANVKDPSYDQDAVNRRTLYSYVDDYVKANAELDLGKPDDDNYILSSDKWGDRKWIPIPYDNVTVVYLTDDTEAITTSADRVFNKTLTVFEDNLYFRNDGKYTTRFTSDTAENAFKIENRHGSEFQIVSYDENDMNPKKLFKLAKDETKFYERPLFAKGISCGTQKIVNLAPPTDAKDAANMQWVQQQIASSRSDNNARVQIAELKLDKALRRIEELESKLKKIDTAMKRKKKDGKK